MNKLGNGYLGCDDLKTSTANEEIIQRHRPSSHTFIKVYKFSFANDANCHIKINGGDAIFLKAGQGFNMDENDAKISTFEIVEAGIPYTYIGAY